jgi:hypothetical protein
LPRVGYVDTENVIRHSQGIQDDGYRPAYIETVRIINVNIQDWSVDCVSEFANKRFFDIQVMSPYFHYMGGEGSYVMPEVGALGWLCKPSGGRFSAPFLMGFQAPFDENVKSYRSNRQSLNPGDMMFRTRDENFVILRRGGVVQIGSTPTCQTIYVPIRNFLKHFCENLEINTFGGEMTWTVDRTDQTVTGNAPATLKIRAKEFANDPAYVADLSIGSHGQGVPVRLELIVRDNGTAAANDMVSLQIDNAGNVTWDLEGSWSLTASKDINLTTEKGDVTVNAAQKMTLAAQKAVSLKSASDELVADGMKKATLSSATEALVKAPKVTLGGSGSIEPVIKGQKLVTFLTSLINQIAAIQQTIPSGPTTASAIAPMTGQLSSLLSTQVFTT